MGEEGFLAESPSGERGGVDGVLKRRVSECDQSINFRSTGALIILYFRVEVRTW